jgi:flagellar capping protein FliD
MFLVLLTEKRQKVFTFFLFLLDLRDAMEVSSSSNSFLFTSPSTVPGGNKTIVSEAKDNLNNGGQSRPGKNDLVFQSLDIVERRAPIFEGVGPLAGFRMAKAVKVFTEKAERNKFPVADNIERSSRFSDFKIEQLGDLRTSLQTLRSTVNVFRYNGAFNLLAAESSREDLVKIKAGRSSPTGTFTITPIRRMISSTLASDEQSTPIEALGLSGNFYINGFKISVETTDSIVELRDKINRGEDTNSNGKLDRAEDINNNGIIDIISSNASEFGAGLYFTEDLDGNGKLDSDEDIIDNNRLDGGVLESGVKATIKNNRLVLSSLAGGSTRIDLRDNENILLQLGFFELNLKGLPIQKELQFDTDQLIQGLSSTNLNVEPRPALVEVDRTFDDPEKIESDFNKFTNISEDAVITSLDESARKVNIQVFFDATNAIAQIKTFVNQFNDSLLRINNFLSKSKEFAQDKEMQNIRNDLTIQPQEKVRTIEKRNKGIDVFRVASENLQGIGFGVVNAKKKTVQDFSTSMALADIMDGATSTFINVAKDVATRLTSAGIRTSDDNTFVIDEPKLKRALEVNAEETLNIFTDEESGILPLLSEQLKHLLRENLGDLDQKIAQVAIQTKKTNFRVGKLGKFTEVSTLNETVKNLITIA